MGPQPTRALVMVGLLGMLAACAAKYPRGGFAVKPVEADAERQCQAGSAAACGALGRMLVEQDVDTDLDRGMVLLEMACGQDDAPACTTLTAVYMSGSPRQTRSLARAHDLAARGCERGTAAACTQLGLVIRLSEGDEDAQAAAFRRGCDLKDADGCELYIQASWRKATTPDAGADVRTED